VSAVLAAVGMVLLAGLADTPAPILVLLHGLVLVAAFDVVRPQLVGSTTQPRAWTDLATALAAQMLTSWPCLPILVVGLFETMSESDALAWALFSVATGMWAVLTARLLRWWRKGIGPVWSRPMRGGFAWSLVTLVFGLAAQPAESLTSRPYSDLIGARYEVIADDLHAYGIQSFPEKQLQYVTLIPGVGIGGNEVAFD
jgi:hypothetical protein